LRHTAISALRLIGRLIPGDYLKTAFYLNVIARPRRALRLALNSFYRMEHIYDVLREARSNYQGKFSILEFGTAAGYSFTKMLYATRYLGMEDRVLVYSFDSFEGLPAPTDRRDQDLIGTDVWVEGVFKASYEELDAYCSRRYANYRLHRGDFEETLTDRVLNELGTYLPILVWIDCNYYTSARPILECLVDYLPTGCVVYFDDLEMNFGSRFTGEARLLHEINSGLLGEGVELVPDRDLSWNSRAVYRFVRFGPGPQYTPLPRPIPEKMRLRTNDSALP
jgi:hypothetical protein